MAAPGLSYAVLGPSLTVAGIGIGLVFPTVATEVMTSVPAPEIGVATGTNSALRELGEDSWCGVHAGPGEHRRQHGHAEHSAEFTQGAVGP